MEEMKNEKINIGPWGNSLSRRNVLIGSAGVATVAGVGLLASCSSSSDTEEAVSDEIVGGILDGIMTQQIPS